MEKIIEFTKMHGLGNDYIYIDMTNKQKNNIEENELPKIARFLSNRHFGIGGDGIILIEKSEIADFKMRIFNSDGTEAEMCGNGIRCFAKYIYENGLTKRENLKIETLAGIKEIKLIKNDKNKIEKIEVNMGIPKIEEKIRLKILDKEFEITNISMGNPHAVIFVDNVEKVDLEKYGSAIENNKYFPNRTNVEFVEILDKNLVKMRVWERGAKETYACGTGACAVVVAGYINNLNKRLQKITQEMEKLAQKISIIRKEKAKVLSEKINNELIDLEMKNAKISVKVEYKENEFLRTGKDEVTFFIKTNVGEDEKELIKIASGGEMSRTMLAIKKVLADSDKTSVLVFDEIDTGISGNAANSVAQKLQAISNKHQVLCISHLPNIAAYADSNFYISKIVNENRTNTNIKMLNEEEIIREIARISSGEVNDVTIKYATELRNRKAS